MSRPERLYGRLAGLLKFGSLFLMAIIGLGLVWQAVFPNRPGLLLGQKPSLVGLGMPSTPLGLLNLSIVLLMFFPVVTVVVCLIYFVSERETRNWLVSLGVLLALILGIILGMNQV